MECRLCGSGDLSLYYTQGNHDEYRYYRCARCGLVNYDLSGGLDQEKYGEVFTDPRDGRLKFNAGQSATFRFIRKHLREKGRLLDIGCGNGRLLMLARDAGWEVAGLELSPPSRGGGRGHARDRGDHPEFPRVRRFRSGEV